MDGMKAMEVKLELTTDMLKEWNACKDGFEWYLKQDSDDAVYILNQLILEEKWDWFSWTATRLMSHKQKAQWSVFCAEQVIDIFEKKYPNDKRPRLAIEAARAWIKNPSKENRNAANVAANAAFAAAIAVTNKAAFAAAYAAAYTATKLTYAAANAAAYATAHAAYAAANAAAYKAMRLVCDKKAILILKRKQKKGIVNENS